MIAIISLFMLQVLQPNYNFGEVKENKVVTHIFKIKNPTHSKIKVLSVSTSCSCTAADYPDEVLPGRTADLKISLDTKGLKGNVTRKIILITDSDDPYLMLSVSAIVKP
jgi:hypothetical protein